MVKLKGDLLRHGIKREVFIAPRALGWRAYLRGESEYLRWLGLDLGELGEHWRNRWAIPRSQRDPRYKDQRRDMMRVSPELEALRTIE
jgi:hypothetical protein